MIYKVFHNTINSGIQYLFHHQFDFDSHNVPSFSPTPNPAPIAGTNLFHIVHYKRMTNEIIEGYIMKSKFLIIVVAHNGVLKTLKIY